MSGCASNPNLTINQLTANQARLAPVAKHGIPSAIPKQASSVSTADGADGSSYRVLQALNPIASSNSSWLARFIRDHVPYRTEASSPAPGSRAFDNASDNVGRVLDLVNRERANAGLAPLRANARLGEMAMTKAQDMVFRNYFSHNSPNYGMPYDMMRMFGIPYRSAGENIAQGQASAAEAMSQWMASPDHRANILSPHFTQIGIGYYNSVWVEEFIG
ncbi:CAP domain-containing protein [Cohnella sp. AR92]|uniref:CAP domain-containing protein n=1 Tax=Cohnella sp. AR92 TaxID=648716 RepID=UPI001EDD5F5F|nr:CAP domain-containing protein [Cohnella sp. AR92]